MKKIIKYLLILLFTISLTFVFTSCKKDQSKDDPNIETEKVVPIYQGVDFGSSSKEEPLKLKGVSKDERDDIIKDDFGILTTDEISYFAKKEERKYISLNFYNPSQFEILSFVLNGVKYQSFQFTEDSTSERISVAITMPNTSGIMTYNIEQIKYIDGQAIKDVRMDGSSNIKVGILYENAPLAICDVVVDYNSVNVISNIVDSSKVVEASNGEFRLYIFDELGIVKKENLKLGNNVSIFNDLKVNKEYIYIICASLDFQDGKGMRTYIIQEDTFRTKDYINISNTIVTETSVGLTINKNFENVEIEKVELLKNNQLVTETINDIVTFNNLLSNTTYLVKVTYSYNNLKYVTEVELVTKQMVAPTVSVIATPNKRSISYEVLSEDKYNILKVNHIDLIKNGVVIKSLNTLKGEFGELLSNNDYEIKVNYSYNLNEGSVDITEEVSTLTHTLSLVAPTVGISYTNGTSLLKGSLVISDVDNIISISSINLYLVSDNSLVDTISSSNNFNFNVTSNTTYKLVVSYSYDLNEGLGASAATYEKEITTIKEVPTISVDTTSITSNSGLVVITSSDNNVTGSIKQIKLYKNDVYLQDVSLVDYTLDSLLSNTTYKVEVIYVYDLNDGTGSHELLSSSTFKTLKETPSISIKEDVTTTKIVVLPEIQDLDSAGSIDKVELLLNNEVIETLNDTFEFDNLLSNTKYVIRLYYNYNLNNGEDTLKVTKEIVTTKKKAPIVDVTLKANKTEVTYDVTYTDIENTFKLESVELVKGNKVINTINTLSGVFNELLSNNDYEVRVNYSYDLNEGNARTTSSISKTIKTQSKSVPTVSIKMTKLSQVLIQGSIIKQDIDNILTINNIKLYQDSVTLYTESSNDFSFDVLPNVKYKLIVSYSYDLNDGSGVITSSYEQEITTIKEVPTISVDTTSVTSNSGLVVITSSDNNVTGSIKQIKLYKNDVYLQDVSLVDYTLDSLLSNTTYKVEVIYVYDLNDGTGSHELLSSSTFKTLKETPSISIKEDVTTTKIVVLPEIQDLDSAGSIDKVELLLNNEVIETLNDTFEFDNLLSNTKYVIRLYYNYNLNNGEDTLKVTKEIVTTKKKAPIVDVTLKANKTEVTYDVTYTDIENTFKLESVELVKGNITISTSSNLKDSFTNLLFNNMYEVRVNYSYDLNEGMGRTTSSISKTIKTMALQSPSVGVKVSNLTSSTLEGSLIIEDVDNIVNINNIKLYMGDNLLDTLYSTNDFNFSVSSNITYKIVVSYSYDLQDGEELHNVDYEYLVTSLKEEPRIIFTPYYIGQTTVEYNLLISDNNVTGRVNLIALYEGNSFVKKLDENTVKLEDLKSNTDYTLKVNYVYDFDDGYGSREVNEEYSFKTLKVSPLYNLVSVGVTKNSFEISHDIDDIDGALSFDKLEVYLNNELIKSTTDINETLFNNLLSNTVYRVVSVYNCDLNNGSYKITNSVDIRTNQMEKPTVEIDTIPNKESFTFDYKVIDTDQISTLDSIELYYNGIKLDLTAIENEFNGLYANSEYELVINLLCDYHDGKAPKIEKYSIDVTTYELNDIEFNVSTSSSKTSVNYSYEIIDVDDIALIKEVRLYLNGKVVKTNTDLSKTSFDDLLSDNLYTVAYVVEKDYRDNGMKEVVEYTSQIYTNIYNDPSASMSFTSSAESIDLSLDISDIDGIIELNKISIYKGDTLVNVVTSFNDLNISNLESNTLYKFVLEYQYDLNDGDGIHIETVTSSYSTLAYNVEVIGYDVLNETTPKTKEEVNIRIYINNKSKVKVSYLIVNNKKIIPSGGDGINNVVFILNAPKESGVMNVDVQKMGYILNGVEVEQVVESLNDININIASRLDILDFTTVNGFNTSKSQGNHGFIVEVDNPEGYRIRTITINGVIYDVIQINNNVLYINILYSQPDMYNFEYIRNGENRVSEINYINNLGQEVVRKFTHDFVFNVAFLERDELSYTLGTHYITTPEELLNVKENNYYVLANDIDMKGYNYNQIATAYIDGKGHKIKNLTYVYEDEYIGESTTFSLGGNFRNVYFENIYINMESKQYVNVNLFDSMSLENVLLSGSININKNNDAGSNFNISYHNEQAYIVGNLLYNGKTYNNNNIISIETFESDEFRTNTLGWNFAPSNVYTNESYKYTVLHDSYVIINKYIGGETNVIVPETLNNLPVIGLEDLAFENATSIKSLEIKSNLIYIGGSILKGCSNLESLYIRDFNCIAGYCSSEFLYYLFGCVSYDNSYKAENGSSLSYYIPNTLRNLTIDTEEELLVDSAYSIYGLQSVENVVIGDKFTYVVIAGLSILKNIEFKGEEYKSIDVMSCANIDILNIPNCREYFRVNNINANIVYIPSKVPYIYMSENNNIDEIYFKGTIEDYLLREDESHFFPLTQITENLYFIMPNNEYSKLVNLIIPNTISHLDGNKLSKIQTIKTVTFEENSILETMDGWMFANMPELESVYLPSSLKMISNHAFANCQKLKSVTFEENSNLKTIDYQAFYGCINLTSIVIPSSLISIGYSALEYCINLKEIIFEDESNLKEIGTYAFANNNQLEKVVIPNSVELVGTGVFLTCASLKVVTFEEGSNLKSIGDQMFSDCDMLEKINIPNGITSIGNSAFFDCNYLREVILPSTLTSIGNSAFGNCIRISSINLPDGLVSIGESAFSVTDSITKIIIPESVEYIGRYAFVGLSKTIYCVANVKPGTWDTLWDGAAEGQNHNIIFGYKK